jgi:hypothetical protein
MFLVSTARPTRKADSPPSATNFSFTSMENMFRHIRFTSCGGPSLASGRVCNLSVQLLQGLAIAVTARSKYRRTRDHILLFHLRLGSLSVASYNSQGCNGGILSSPHMRGGLLRGQLYFCIRRWCSSPTRNTGMGHYCRLRRWLYLLLTQCSNCN